MAQPQKKGDKWKLKKWFSVYAPKQFNDAVIGEMPANDEKSAVGRNIVIGLDTLTHNPNHAYTNVVLKVTSAEGSAAQTKLIAITQLYSYIRSLVRRYKSIATLILPVSTKDGTKLVFKMLVITRQRATGSRIAGIRKEMNERTLTYAKETDAAELISSVIDGKFQAEMAAKLRHITPISKVEVRSLEIKS
jgi:small subunit ribosomal protein S3Ae